MEGGLKPRGELWAFFPRGVSAPPLSQLTRFFMGSTLLSIPVDACQLLSVLKPPAPPWGEGLRLCLLLLSDLDLRISVRGPLCARP